MQTAVQNGKPGKDLYFIKISALFHTPEQQNNQTNKRQDNMLAAWRPSLLSTRHHLLPSTTTILRSSFSSSPNTSSDLKPTPDFTDTKASYAGLSTYQLARGWAVLKICSFTPIVKNAEFLLSTSRKILGDSFVKFFIHPTFFSHFCAGETEDTIRPTVDFLKHNGVGAILDYAAEADIEEDGDEGGNENDKEEYPSARVYRYSTERECDANAEIFASCIHAVKNVTPEGYAAIKMTALGNPLLLERMSSSIVEVRSLFHRMNTSHDGQMTYDEFQQSWSKYFERDDASDKFVRDMFDRFDVTGK